jgi:branched-chain amino acid aminotransferase
MGFSLQFDRSQLGRELRQAIEESGYDEVKMRIGTASGLDHFVVTMEPSPGVLTDERENGVSCVTVRHTARSSPRAKQTGWLTTRKSFPRSQPTSAYEYLLVDHDDRILEGSSSNFYAILGEPPVLRTAGEQVLGGIARSIVLEIAPPVVQVELTAIDRSQLPEARETFLTSATRGIIPIVQVDRRPVGTGNPGPITRGLMQLYDRRAEELEESL